MNKDHFEKILQKQIKKAILEESYEDIIDRSTGKLKNILFRLAAKDPEYACAYAKKVGKLDLLDEPHPELGTIDCKEFEDKEGEGTPEEVDGKEVSPEDKAIPLYKKTPGMKGTPEKPLSSQLLSWGFPQKAVNQIIKAIRDQLKTNQIEVSESKILKVLVEVVDEAVRIPGASKETSLEFDKKFQELRTQKAKYEKIAKDPKSSSRKRRNATRHIRGLELDLQAMLGAHGDWGTRTGGKKGEKSAALAARGAKAGKGGQAVLDKEIPVQSGTIKISAPVAQYAKLFGVEDKDKRRKMVAQVKKWLRRRLKARDYDDSVINMVKESRENYIDLTIEENV